MNPCTKARLRLASDLSHLLQDLRQGQLEGGGDQRLGRLATHGKHRHAQLVQNRLVHLGVYSMNQSENGQKDCKYCIVYMKVGVFVWGGNNICTLHCNK